MLPSMMSTQAYTRKRYPSVVDHGTTVTDYTASPTLALYHGSIQPGEGGADLVNREGAEVVYTIFGQPDDDVHHRDVVNFSGSDYLVDGEPQHWGTGILDHQLIRLVRWAG